MNQEFTVEQKNYLQGFAAGSSLSASLGGMPTFAGTLGLAPAAKPKVEQELSSPDSLQRAAQDRFLADGKALSAEEKAKRVLHGLDVWDKMLEHAQSARFPKGTDVFLFKFLGMFFVAPAQNSFMCRLRIPGGFMSAHQLAGVAELAEKFGGGYADVTTRANLQIRQITAEHTADVLMGLSEIGIVNKGAGADNIRNITASPTAGIDPRELIDTRPLAKQMHHYILNHREMYGLPRKFNIAFDGGGSVSALEDTNDIGFFAVEVGTGQQMPAGVYFRMALGGITGHEDFARDTGVLLKPEDCVAVAAAAVRVFIEHGDRTDRKKARLKYLLDRWGLEKFLEETVRHLPAKLTRFPIENCLPRPLVEKHGHIGVHTQKQTGKSYIGVVLPVGRMNVAQMRRVAELATQFGSAALRLTVWQNLLISDIADSDIPLVQAELEKIGLHWSASSVRGGLVACTGSAGCKFAAADTKRHAMQVADYLDTRVKLNHPINIHLTGCAHSCAQHYIGDIGMIATKVAVGEEMVEGYHVYIGGGYGAERGIGRCIWRDVIASDLPVRLELLLNGYVENRNDEEESFRDFVLRHPTDELKKMFEERLSK